MLSVKTDEIAQAAVGLFDSRLTRGELNNSNDIVNSNDIRKHIVNIDSRFRKSYLEPICTSL